MKFTAVLQLAEPGQGKTRQQLINDYNKALKETRDQLERSYIQNRIITLQQAQERNNKALQRDIAAGRFNN